MNTLLATALSCFVVVSGGTNGNWKEKLQHEMAHCNGWVHPGQAGGYHQAYSPPKEFIRPFKGKLTLRRVSTSKAMLLCDGHFACYELN